MNRRGFTLAELLVAFALLVTALTTLLGVFVGSTQSLRASEERFCALDLCEKLLEEQRARGPASVAASSGRVTSTFVHNGREYTLPLSYRVSVTAVEAGRLQDVLAQVEWVSSSGVRTVRLETLVGP